MTRTESVRHDIGLAFDFVRYLVNHPDMIPALPDKFELELIENGACRAKTDRKPSTARKYFRVNRSFEPVRSLKRAG